MMLVTKQLDIIKKHQQRAPVQTVPIAQELGVKVYRVPDWENNISGMIIADKELGGESGYAIFVNGQHPEVRRRFTIAHEIAHFILHPHLIGDGIVEDALLRAEGLSNQAETQANQMAADILMPWHLILAYQQRGATTVTNLASAFNVARDAMSIRLLGIPYQEANAMRQAESTGESAVAMAVNQE